MIESLLPHVRQFVRVRQALVGADALSASLTGLLDKSRIGVLHLDRTGRVLAANGPAVDVLRRGEGLSDRDGALRAALPADDGRLQKLLKRALPVFGSAEPPTGGSMTIQRPLLRSRLDLHVHPVEAGQADFGGRCTAEERARYRSLLALGLTDLFRHLHPQTRAFSWWDYRGGSFHRGLGLCIDLLLGVAAVASRVRRVEIDREYRKKQDGHTASDHAPVFADLD